MSALFAYFQYLLPKHWLTAIVFRIARIRAPRVKNLLIRNFARLYRVDVDEVRNSIPDGFDSFNDFFVRELKEGARPIDSDATAIVSPVDGTVSQAGRITQGTLLQAKGIDYSVRELLAIDLDVADTLENGHFATIYLAPYNYHRVHAPLAGQLVSAHYVPGDLFSVNKATAGHIPRLFSRNERLNLHIDTQAGRMVLIMVGALNVGSISTPWTGTIRPRSSGVAEMLDLATRDTRLEKGDLLGWFNMGSTVILLLPEGAGSWDDGLLPDKPVLTGRSIGRLSSTNA